VNAFKAVKGINFPMFNILHFSDMRDDDHHLLVEDITFRSAIVLKLSAYRDYAQQRELGDTTYNLHRSTVALLISRFSEPSKNFLIDTTIYVINVLAAIAIWLGKQNELNAHIRAMQHIVRLCGGKRFLT